MPPRVSAVLLLLASALAPALEAAPLRAVVLEASPAKRRRSLLVRSPDAGLVWVHLLPGDVPLALADRALPGAEVELEIVGGIRERFPAQADAGGLRILAEAPGAWRSLEGTLSRVEKPAGDWVRELTLEVRGADGTRVRGRLSSFASRILPPGDVDLGALAARLQVGDRVRVGFLEGDGDPRVFYRFEELGAP